MLFLLTATHVSAFTSWARRAEFVLCFVAVLLSSGAVMASAERVHAATLIVTTTADSGPGSLRAAIAAASDGDTIQFDPALNGQTIALTSGELAINKNITINGPGPVLLTISRDQQASGFRIFHVTPGHAVTIGGLTISGGVATGGGVLNDQATLTLDNCTVSGNRGGFSASGTSAGGIFNGGTITISGSTVSGNVANVAGGIDNFGTLVIRSAIVTNNRSNFFDPPPSGGSAGGIENVGTLEISSSTISNNWADVFGGGIVNYGMMTVTDSTVSGNVAAGMFGTGTGGGVSNGGSHAEIHNSTVSSNLVDGDGGGINSAGPLTITNSTISDNRASQNGGGIFNVGGNTTLEIGDTILKASAFGTNIFNSGGTVISRGYNVSNDDGGGFLTATGDQINTDPMLGPLQDNGGPTFTHDLLTGSPAINTGHPNFTPPPFTDQRGYPRVFNGRIDIGSLEVQPAPTPTATPSVTPSPTPPPTPSPPAEMTYNISVHNNVGYAGSPLVRDTLPPGVDYVSVIPSQGTCTGTSTIDCNLGTLPGFSTATVVLVVRPTVTGTLLNTAILLNPDPFPSNNSSTAETTVLPAGTPSPTATPTPTATATPSPTAPAQSLNLSTRMLVQTGDRVGIAGFIITGGAPKRVIMRAVHCMICIPEVSPLADPVLELHGPSGFVTIINDNWRDTQEAEIIATGLAPNNDSDSAIVVTLPPGNYTAIVRGKNNTSGVALVEVYDLSQAEASKLANISTRAFVSTGGDILIAGFILGNGAGDDNVILRGLGPSLAGAGVPNVLADPTLELRDGNGALIRADDNWMDDPFQAFIITAVGLAPRNNLESGIAATLSPGQYTALLAGTNSGTGNGLVEVYDLGATPIDYSPTPAPTPTATATATADGTPPPPSPTPSASPSPTPTGPCVGNFDGVVAPALPPGWSGGWMTSTIMPETPPNDLFVDDQDGISDKIVDRMNGHHNEHPAYDDFPEQFQHGI
jgi:hypothetical protein